MASLKWSTDMTCVDLHDTTFHSNFTTGIEPAAEYAEATAVWFSDNLGTRYSRGKKRSPIARTVLDAASLLDCKHIDKDLLLKYTLADCIENTTSKGKLHMATSLLSQFCLLEEDTGRTYHMHSLVQESVVEGMVRDGTLCHKLFSLSKCLTDILPDIKRNLNNSRILELVPRVYMVASHILTSEQQDLECWKLLGVACSMAILLQHLTDAEELCKQRLQLVRSTKMPKRLFLDVVFYISSISSVGLWLG